MANELKLEVHAVFLKDGIRQEFHLPLLEIDVTGARASRLSQTLSTSEEALDFAEITAGGYVILFNRSTTAGEDVTVKIKTTETSGIEIPPGEIAGPFRFNSAAVPVAVAAAGTPTLDMLVIEN